jgi:hypothetical protein
MTDEEIKINIAIAEACGFTDIMWPMGFHQQMSDEKSKQCGGRWRFAIPDYCNCLNAIHEAEKYLMDESSVIYKEELEKVSCIWHSTAKQKAIAFLKAKGKWKED